MKIKRWISVLLVLCMAVSMLPVSAMAVSEVASGTCGDDLTWVLTDDGTLTISGNGPMTNYSYDSSNRAPWFGSRDSIIAVAIANGITTIGKYAFRDCSSLTSVTIPDSITSIDSGAFYDCSSLTSVTIPDSVTSIGDSAFYSCYSLTSVTIPDSVTSIGYSAFARCSSLTSVTIPDSVISIGHCAFARCHSLRGIYVNNNSQYSSDSYGVLYNKAKTKLIQVPGGYRGHYSIPNSVSSIGDDAFTHCASLTSVTISDSVSSIGDNAFTCCTSLTSVTIPDSVTSIGDYAFYSCESLTSVTIPDSVTTIGNWAFRACSSLTSVTIGNSVTSIGDDAFADCDSLTSVTIPDSVTYIHDDAFSSCDSLTRVNIGNSVTIIGYGVFVECDSLTEIYFRGNAPSFSGNVFSEVTATAYYPANDPTWTADVMQDYGGTITWVPYYPKTSVPNNGAYNTPQESVWYDIWCVGDRYKSYERNFTLTVGDVDYSTGDSYKARADIPYDLSDQVSVSKEGRITCQIPQELVYTCREVVLHPDATTAPFVNFIACRNSGDSIYANLACSHLSVYENALRTYEMYVDINWNGHTPGKVYLQQGDQTLNLREGKNVGLMLGMFSASNGDVLLRWETANGTGYSQRMYLDIYKNSSSNLKLNGGEDSTGKNPASAEEDEMWGDLEFKIDLFNDSVPVEMTMTPISATTGTFKGSIGVKIDNYENKRTIIDFLDTNLNANWDYTAFESMKKSLKTKFPDTLIPQQASSFVISVDTEFLGYVEGTYTLGADGSLVDMEFTDSKIVTGLDGEFSTARQHLAGNIPWYWELELKSGVALALELQNEYDGTMASIAPITTKAELEIGAKAAAGVVKTAGLGVSGGGTAHVEGQIVPVDLSKTDIYADYDIALFLQFGNWTMDFFPYQSEKYYLMDDGQWIWEEENASGEGDGGGGIRSLKGMAELEMQQISRSYLKTNTQPLKLFSNSDTSDNVIHANTYTFTEPQIVKLDDERMLMVWVDDPGTEIRPLDVNRTALYYSVYDGTAWSEPAMVYDDGTADASPVLRNIDETVYLIWCNCNTVLTEDAQYEDYAAALDITYARFDSENGIFADISAVDTNDHSDFLHDIAVINGVPTVVWVQNSENDLLLGTGVNTLYKAQLNAGAWDVNVLSEDLHSVDGLRATTENDTLMVYISQDSDDDVSTISDRELYAVTDDTMTQVTDNSVSDLKPMVIDGILYWYQDGVLTDGVNIVELEEDTDRLIVVENDSQSAVLYKRYNDDGTTTIFANIYSDGVWSSAMEVVTVEQYLHHFDSVMQDDNSLIIITNEIEMTDNSFDQANLCMYQVGDQCDIVIQGFTYNPLSIAPLGNLELIAAIQNNGSETVKEVYVRLYEGETLLQEEIMALDLCAGADSALILTYPLSSNNNPASIRIDVQPVNQDERKPQNNTAECVIPWADVSVEEVTAFQTNTGTCVSAYVSNRGLTGLSDIQIELYTQQNGEKIVIADKEIATLAVAMGEIVTFDTNLESDTTIYVNVTAEHDEFNVANNSGFTLIAEEEVILNPDEAVPHVHEYERVVTAPTCTEMGQTTYTCICGDTYTESTDALGHSFENSICTICGTGAVLNVDTTATFSTLMEAVEAAAEGQTLKLQGDCTEAQVMVTPGVTLDLNGYTLTVDYLVCFDTAHLIDNVGTGHLIAEMKHVVLDEENAMVPVYDGVGYIFTKVGFAIRQDEGYTGDGMKINALAYPVNMDIVELLKDGSADNDIQVIIRLNWDTADGTGSQEFVFMDEVVGDVYSSNNGTWNSYSKMFSMVITGFENIKNLRANMVIISGTNVQYVSSTSISIT